MFDLNEPTKRTQFVWIRDQAGHEYICDQDALRDPKSVSAGDLMDCIDEAKSPRPFAGG